MLGPRVYRGPLYTHDTGLSALRVDMGINTHGPKPYKFIGFGDIHGCPIKIIILILVFGRFPAELGPETRSNGSGSKNGAGRTQN